LAIAHDIFQEINSNYGLTIIKFYERLTQRQSDELASGANAGASVTTSSIARYALEKFVSDHIAKRDGTKIFIEISTADATEEDISWN